MKFPLKRAGRLIGLTISLSSLIICVLAPCVTVISWANKDLPAIVSLPGNSAAQRLLIKESKATRLGESFGNLPLHFEQNVGQFDKSVRFFCHGKGYDLSLAGNEVVFKLEKVEERKRNVCEEVVGDCERLKLPHSAFCLAPSSSTVSFFGNPQQPESKKSGDLQSSARISSLQSLPQAERSDKNVTPSQERSATRAASVSRTTATVRLKFIGGNASSRLTGLDALPTKSNYFIGNHPKQWRTDVANYARVEYANLYRGIDAIVYGNPQNLEYDFKLAVGADFKAIRLSFEGAESLRIDEQGDLIIETTAGEIRQHKPVAYQEVNGERKEIVCHYKIFQASTKQATKPQKRQAQSASRNLIVGFAVGEYDKTLPLTIDPVLDFSTCLGGGNGLSFTATDVALDAEENIYVVGYIFPLPVPASGAVHTQELSIREGVFVAKLDSVNKRLVYVTNLRGENLPGFFYSYFSTGIAVDAAGNAYVTGYTSSAAFPTTQGAFQTTLQGNTNAFITKLSPEGNALVYSTFLGAADSSSAGTPPQCSPQSRSCVTKASDIAIDAVGNTYLTGSTSARSFPTTANAFKPAKSDDDCTSATNDNSFAQICTEAFVTKLNAAGTALIYSTFLGGNGNDSGEGIALDASGNAYTVGTTAANDFPTQNALYGSYLGGTNDTFLSKLNATGTTLLYSTYLGGTGSDTGKAIDIDATGNVYLCGDTNSTDLPTTAAVFQNKPGNPYLFKTTDSGVTWKPLLKGLGGAGSIVAIAIEPNNSANLFAGTNSGVYQSTDGGESWQAPSGRPTGFFSFLTFAPQNPSVSFAAPAQQGSGDNILLRSTDKGNAWNELSYPKVEGISGGVYDLQVDPTDLSTFYLAETAYSKILKTTDGGATWKFIDAGFPLQSYQKLLGINPQNPALLFATAGSLFRSKDGGTKWKPTDLVDTNVFHIGFNPSNPAVVYAAGNKLFGSTDSGTTWNMIENNLTDFYKILVAANSLYAISSGKLFKSTDGGKNWTDIGSPFGLTSIRTLAIDPKYPATLYAGSQRFDNDSFVMKINAQASAISYCTYLAGDSYEIISNIAVDDFGNASVTGSTNSFDFPTHNPIQAKSISGSTAFVTKLNPTGGAVYSTYLGGNYSDRGGGVATDKAGRVYVVGTTLSNQFPQITPLQSLVGNGASFILRIVDLPLANPEPVVLSVTPDSGVGVGQTRVTIKGANFLPGATVSIGSELAQETVVLDANTIQTTARGFFGGRANIVVMNPDGQIGILPQGFNFLLVPLIQRGTIENNQLVILGILGSPVGPGGYGFDNGAVLLINGTEVKTDPPTTRETLKSKKALKRIGRGQTVQLQVRNANGLLSNIFIFTRP